MHDLGVAWFCFIESGLRNTLVRESELRDTLVRESGLRDTLVEGGGVGWRRGGSHASSVRGLRHP